VDAKLQFIEFDREEERSRDVDLLFKNSFFSSAKILPPTFESSLAI
jgi:hypothetical protein